MLPMSRAPALRILPPPPRVRSNLAPAYFLLALDLSSGLLWRPILWQVLSLGTTGSAETSSPGYFFSCFCGLFFFWDPQDPT